MRSTAAVSEGRATAVLLLGCTGGERFACWASHCSALHSRAVAASAPLPIVNPTLVDSCTVKNYGWTFIAGLCLMIVAQLPSMSRAELVTLMTTVFLCTYSIIAVVLAGTQGGCRGQAPPGGWRRRLCASAWPCAAVGLQRLAAPAASRQLQVRSGCCCGAT